MESMNGPDFRRRADADLLRLVQSRSADDPERQAACEILVGRYENIVRSCVYRYRTGPELSEDLMQVGYVGLMKAINNFDPEVGEQPGRLRSAMRERGDQAALPGQALADPGPPVDAGAAAADRLGHF